MLELMYEIPSRDDIAEVARAYETRQVALHAKISVRIKEVLVAADGELPDLPASAELPAEIERVPVTRAEAARAEVDRLRAGDRRERPSEMPAPAGLPGPGALRLPTVICIAASCPSIPPSAP